MYSLLDSKFQRDQPPLQHLIYNHPPVHPFLYTLRDSESLLSTFVCNPTGFTISISYMHTLAVIPWIPVCTNPSNSITENPRMWYFESTAFRLYLIPRMRYCKLTWFLSNLIPRMCYSKLTAFPLLPLDFLCCILGISLLELCGFHLSRIQKNSYMLNTWD